MPKGIGYACPDTCLVFWLNVFAGSRHAAAEPIPHPCGLTKGSTSGFGMAYRTRTDRGTLARRWKRDRLFRLIILIVGNGFSSSWQSRQRDRREVEFGRRSSEVRGALHSWQRGGPTRPLWSCAMKIPLHASVLSGAKRRTRHNWRPAFSESYWWVDGFENQVITQREGTKDQRGPIAPTSGASRIVSAEAESATAHASAEDDMAVAGAVNTRTTEWLRCWVKPAPHPAMQSQLPPCIDFLYDISRSDVNRKTRILNK